MWVNYRGAGGFAAGAAVGTLSHPQACVDLVSHPPMPTDDIKAELKQLERTG